MKKTRMTVIVAIFVSIAMATPLCVAAINSTAFVSDNEVTLDNLPNAGITVKGSGYSPVIRHYICDEGNVGFRIQSTSSNINMTSTAIRQTPSVTVPADCSFCIHIYKPIHEGFQSSAEVDFSYMGVSYKIKDDSENGYYSVHYLGSNNNLEPQDSLDGMTYMSFDEDIVFNMNVKREITVFVIPTITTALEVSIIIM